MGFCYNGKNRGVFASCQKLLLRLPSPKELLCLFGNLFGFLVSFDLLLEIAACPLGALVIFALWQLNKRISPPVVLENGLAMACPEQALSRFRLSQRPFRRIQEVCESEARPLFLGIFFCLSLRLKPAQIFLFQEEYILF